LVVTAVLDQRSRTRLENPSSKSAIDALMALCFVFPVLSGIPFRMIRRYATFVPSTNPAASVLIKDKAMKQIGMTNINE
jgi:hypothetical protein